MRSKSLFIFFVILGMFSWAIVFVNAKYLSAYINEYEAISYRYFIAILTTLPLLYYFKNSIKINLKSLVLATINGVLLALYTAFFFLGTSIGDIGIGGSIITTCMPLIAFSLMMLFSIKKPSKEEWKILFIGLLGLLIILEFWLFDLDQIFTKATIFFLLAAFFWALMFITTSKSANIHPIIFSLYTYLACTISTSLLFYNKLDISVLFNGDLLFWVNMILMSVLGTTFATTIYFMAVQRFANNAIVFTFLVPFFTIVLGILLFQEELRLSTIIGVIIISIAIIIMKGIKVNDYFKNTFARFIKNKN